MRIYCRWGGKPQGTPEDPKRCVASVPDGGRSPLSHQCNHPRGKGTLGDLCGVHARTEKKYGRGWIPPEE